MNEETLREYFNIYTDCWKFFKKYSNPTEDEQFWKNLTNESIAIYSKYPEEDEFVAQILRCTIDEINNVLKKSRKE